MSPVGSTEFGAALHEMLAGAGVPAAARRWADGDLVPGLEVWRRLAGLGVTALAVPEKWGGLGASPLDLVVACEELGHHAVPGPVAESVAAIPELLRALIEDGPRSADGGRCEELCGGWLTRLAAGELATLAMPPRLPYAVDADAADMVLLVSADAVAIAAPGARHQSVDPARSLF